MNPSRLLSSESTTWLTDASEQVTSNSCTTCTDRLAVDWTPKNTFAPAAPVSTALSWLASVVTSALPSSAFASPCVPGMMHSLLPRSVNVKVGAAFVAPGWLGAGGGTGASVGVGAVGAVGAGGTAADGVGAIAAPSGCCAGVSPRHPSTSIVLNVIVLSPQS